MHINILMGIVTGHDMVDNFCQQNFNVDLASCYYLMNTNDRKVEGLCEALSKESKLRFEFMGMNAGDRLEF